MLSDVASISSVVELAALLETDIGGAGSHFEMSRLYGGGKGDVYFGGFRVISCSRLGEFLEAELSKAISDVSRLKRLATI